MPHKLIRASLNCAKVTFPDSIEFKRCQELDDLKENINLLMNSNIRSIDWQIGLSGQFQQQIVKDFINFLENEARIITVLN